MRLYHFIVGTFLLFLLPWWAGTESLPAQDAAICYFECSPDHTGHEQSDYPLERKEKEEKESEDEEDSDDDREEEEREFENWHRVPDPSPCGAEFIQLSSACNPVDKQNFRSSRLSTPIYLLYHQLKIPNA